MGRRGPRPKSEKVPPISAGPNVSTGYPQPPDALDRVELECWQELMVTLASTKHLASEHVHICELAARTLAAMRRADATLAKDGMFFTHSTGYKSQHPAVSVSLKNRTFLKTLLVEMGATPLSRDQVTTPAPMMGSRLDEFLRKASQP
jgi:P27 family predicted phage terminase small subunit